MDKTTKKEDAGKENASWLTSEENPNNPFENNKPIEQELKQSGESLESEQQFKEAQRERD